MVHDSAPAWVRVTGEAAWVAVPVLVGLALLALRLAKPIRFYPFAYASGAILPTVMVFAFVAFGDTISDRLHRRSFDGSAWQEAADGDSHWPARLRMVDDLLRRHDMHGWPRSRVEQLLGPPDETAYDEWDMAYLLGPIRYGFGLGSEWFVLRLDENGRVTDYRIMTDD
jgi:hypothetical protein